MQHLATWDRVHPELSCSKSMGCEVRKTIQWWECDILSALHIEAVLALQKVNKALPLEAGATRTR